jgi:NarL family two-component system response regulator LiaR
LFSYLSRVHIHVAIVDDDAALAKTLKRELLEFPEFDSVVLAHSGQSFLDQLAKLPIVPNVVLMDISMATVDEGIRTTNQVHERYPDIRIVMFTMAEDSEMVFDAFKAGAIGYVLKNEKLDSIRKVLLDVYRGGAFISPAIAIKAIQFFAGSMPVRPVVEAGPFQLTPREAELLRLVGKGYTSVGIADQLSLSPETVKKHISNIFKKLHVKNRVEALNKTKDWL